MHSFSIVTGCDHQEQDAASRIGSVPVPADEAGIDSYRQEIDQIDADLVDLVRRRTDLSRAIGIGRRGQGGPRVVYSRELAVLRKFRALGPRGAELGLLLLELGRGSLGHLVEPLPDVAATDASFPATRVLT
jgi:chorismate mutase